MIHSLRSALAAVTIGGFLFSAASVALAGAQDYQFTGDVTAVTATSFTVLKGKQSWDFAKDANSKAPADLKVGDKVTVHYVMNAVSVEPSAKAKNPPKDRAKKGEAAASPAAAASSPAAEASPKP